MSRVQVALNVNDIDEAVGFYTKLFGTGPAKRMPGYANFAVTEPPLKLVLLENPGQGGTLNHLGIEVPSIESVDVEQTRLAGAGLVATDKSATTCCYATQDKFWVRARRPASPGRSTPCWKTALPSMAMTPQPMAMTPQPQLARPGPSAGAGSAVCCGGAQEPGDPATAPAARCC